MHLGAILSQMQDNYHLHPVASVDPSPLLRSDMALPSWKLWPLSRPLAISMHIYMAMM